MTGSVEAGQQIAAAAGNVTPLSLELGGKAPFIVLDDADLDLAVRHAMSSRFTNCGQVCTCNERTYVQEGVFAEFSKRYLSAPSALRVGDPLDPHTDMGPQVSREEMDKVDRMVGRAREQGARVLLGGEPLRGEGYGRGFWYPPTILADVRQDMEIMHAEVFGPVSPLVRFSEFDEAVALANDSQYGLSAYLFTNDFRRVMRAIRDVDFGEVYVNRSGPEAFHAFHSAYRRSGIGGDDGRHGFPASGRLRPAGALTNPAASGRPPDASGAAAGCWSPRAARCRAAMARATGTAGPTGRCPCVGATVPPGAAHAHRRARGRPGSPPVCIPNSCCGCGSALTMLTIK